MDLTQAIMATVCYYDVFNFPLTQQQIFSFLVYKKTNKKTLLVELEKIIRYQKLQVQDSFYFLKYKKKIVMLRQKRKRYSESKLKKAKIYAGLLKMIPTIQFVGISGALSMENSTKFDDIDLVIISRKNWLWTTRFLTNVLLFPVKRRPGLQKTNNRACLNLFLDESDLKIKNENLYQAHEICQLKPVWQRNNAYYRFIKANSWVKKYLPNWKPKPISDQQLTINNKKRGARSHFSTFSFQFSILESLLKKVQLIYMRRRVTTEQIGEKQLFFHPSNTQARVLKEYEKRIKKLV